VTAIRAAGSDDTPNMLRAQSEAVNLAREHLRGADLARNAQFGGLALASDGSIELQLLGRTLRVETGSLVIHAGDGAAVHVVEELLVLRYLAAEFEIRPVGELISFREFPGGMFYLQPILNRTSQIVLGVFGNDIARLRSALDHFPHVRLTFGDLSVQINAIGRIDVTLVYRRGDEEFPPTLDILFDQVVPSVYKIDEAATLAHRLCVALARRA
jgi:hypothetical protein